MLVQFGKHKGKDVREVPSEYIWWYIGTKSAELSEWEAELVRRGAKVPTPISEPDPEGKNTDPKFVPESPEKPEILPDHLCVFEESKLKALVFSAMNRGFNDFLQRTQAELKKSPNITFTKQEVADLLKRAANPPKTNEGD